MANRARASISGVVDGPTQMANQVTIPQFYTPQSMTFVYAQLYFGTIQQVFCLLSWLFLFLVFLYASLAVVSLQRWAAATHLSGGQPIGAANGTSGLPLRAGWMKPMLGWWDLFLSML